MIDQARRAAGLVVFLGLLAVGGLAQAGAVMDQVRGQGVLRCGVEAPLPGLAMQDETGAWRGFDVDLCRAIAAAALGTADGLEVLALVPAEAQARLTAKAVDLLARDRASGLPSSLAGTVFATASLIDAQGLLVPRSANQGNALGLDGKRVCLLADGSHGDNLARFARASGISLEPMGLASEMLMAETFFGGGCAALSAGRLTMARLRSQFDPGGAMYDVLEDVLSRDQMGPYVALGDREWLNLVRWTLFALISAEELGVTAARSEVLRRTSVDPRVLRLLGAEGSLGEALGLDSDWALRAIQAVGHYGEIYDRNLGPDTPLALERGPNALWNDGGLLVAPPFH